MDSQKYGQGRSKSRSRSRPQPRRSNERKISRNPFLNFIRDLREDAPDTMTYKEVLIQAGKRWKKMPAKEKKMYIDEASKIARDAPPKKDTKKKPKGTTDKKKITNSNKKKAAKRMRDNDDASTISYDSDCTQESSY
ncbi:high mobility group protein 20A-like [Ischnura elegans]|uniref:high mobility group protein 20A-like n=1 Tax=Ischnura elegans TaxID=197161 RepID=UPI001ED87B3E|nr:high mobility group protein 20A-like [Ischnura elegans]